MRVRFEIDVERSAAGFFAGRFQREDLGVLDAIVGVGSGADDVALSIGDHCADAGIGRRQADALARQFECVVKELFVGEVGSDMLRESYTDCYA